MSRFKWKGNLAKQAARSGAVRGLQLASEYTLESANRTVPHQDGDLARSSGTDVDQANLTASVYYDTPYARKQHEELEYQHAEGRRAKWLELTIDEEREKNKEIIGNEIRKRMR